ncbi:MAG TPA: phosphatase PAP2 family protein [Candidatus Paceibacterota bacterium]|nr:phosphatase PAP2 family protein [Candidatus Paceibacterota bacterium]
MPSLVDSILSRVSELDSSLIYLVQSIGPGFQGIARFISHGAISNLVFLALVLGALLLIEKWRISLEVVIIALVSYGALVLLKLFFHVDRPYAVDPLVVAYDKDIGFGLPSIHAAMSVVVLGWIALRHPKSHVVLWGSVALIVLVGLSRVYLGVHYPSQVLAGWIFGILFLYIFRVIDKRLWSPFQKKLK